MSQAQRPWEEAPRATPTDEPGGDPFGRMLRIALPRREASILSRHRPHARVRSTRIVGEGEASAEPGLDLPLGSPGGSPSTMPAWRGRKTLYAVGACPPACCSAALPPAGHSWRDRGAIFDESCSARGVPHPGRCPHGCVAGPFRYTPIRPSRWIVSGNHRALRDYEKP